MIEFIGFVVKAISYAAVVAATLGGVVKLLNAVQQSRETPAPSVRRKTA